jgi:hypothetical protein
VAVNMKKRLSSLVLLLVLAGGMIVGMPLHLGENECSNDMMGMDCCKAALMQRGTPEVDAAKLCCAVNCAQTGTTSPPNVVRVTPPTQAVHPIHPALTSPLPNPLLHRVGSLHSPPGSPPTYLRNLALLI